MNRAALAAACTIPDLTNVTPLYRQSLKVGDGFVRFGKRDRDTTGFGWIDTWEVWVALPAAPADAEQWLDNNLDELLQAAALGGLAVTTATPSDMVIGSNILPGVIIAGTSIA